MEVICDARYGLVRPLNKHNLFGATRATVRQHRTPVPEGIFAFFQPVLHAYFTRITALRHPFWFARRTVAPAHYQIVDSRTQALAYLPAFIYPPPRLTLRQALYRFDNLSDAALEAVAVDLFDFARMIEDDLPGDFARLVQSHPCLQRVLL